MTGVDLALALGVFLVVAFALGPGRAAEQRLARVLPPSAVVGPADPAPVVAWSDRLPLPVVAALMAVGLALLVGGGLGVVLGAGAAVAVLKVVPRLESKARRARRLAMAAQAPDVVDLLSACLASGAVIERAVAVVADAVDPPAAGVLQHVSAQLRLGAEPHAAWALAADDPALAPLAVAVGRALDSGAALSDALPAVADDLRERRRAVLESAARQVGVRLTAPLGLAFLPAFVLLGVVPVIGALVASMMHLP